MIKELHEHVTVIEQTITHYEKELHNITQEIINRLEKGGKILIFGNGGSAADAQHIAAELVGSFSTKERKALPAIALTTDSSALTSISNDFSYAGVFKRQLEAFLNPNDVVIGISTSGNSENVVSALEYGYNNDGYCVGLSGNSGGKMNDITHTNIVVQSNSTPRIQEVHIFIGHMLCDSIDEHFL
jgi:D-sedoheptulose 7-phosphate isomerase